MTYCVYCKASDAERGADGISLCPDCNGRFTEGVPATTRVKTDAQHDADWERWDREDAQEWHAEQSRREERDWS
jgi:ribosomal protein L37AE/L43A